MMGKGFNFLFSYLDKEQIKIDREEFYFQIQSHPHYPSLLSISDTLEFFSVDNIAFNAYPSDIGFLPHRFLALLNHEEGNSTIKSQIYLIEKRNESYYYFNDGKWLNISISSLSARWQNVVLLIQKSTPPEINSGRRPLAKIILSIHFALSFLCLFYTIGMRYQSYLFFLPAFFGILCSIIALKDLFGVTAKLISEFCNISSSTDCDTVIHSAKWPFLKFINFSDLSIVFFCTQFLGLFFFAINANYLDFFAIQKVLLFIAVPFILISLYFQKFAVKKWCPICLTIIAIMLLELTYLNIFFPGLHSIKNYSIFLFLTICFALMIMWFLLKRLLTKVKNTEESLLKANRFLRNYNVFKNTLLSNQKFDFPAENIILGNIGSDLTITMITNPFCRYCKNAHEIIDNILTKYSDKLRVELIMNVDLSKEDNTKRNFYRSLLNIYFEKGEKALRDTLSFWFTSKDISLWMKKFHTVPQNVHMIDNLFLTQNIWCRDNQLTFTPVIFINGYKYPEMYSRDSIVHFINDLIDDSQTIV